MNAWELELVTAAFALLLSNQRVIIELLATDEELESMKTKLHMTSEMAKQLWAIGTDEEGE